jgi:hypothetical protein
VKSTSQVCPQFSAVRVVVTCAWCEKAIELSPGHRGPLPTTHRGGCQKNFKRHAMSKAAWALVAPTLRKKRVVRRYLTFEQTVEYYSRRHLGFPIVSERWVGDLVLHVRLSAHPALKLWADDLYLDGKEWCEGSPRYVWVEQEPAPSVSNRCRVVAYNLVHVPQDEKYAELFKVQQPVEVDWEPIKVDKQWVTPKRPMLLPHEEDDKQITWPALDTQGEPTVREQVVYKLESYAPHQEKRCIDPHMLRASQMNAGDLGKWEGLPPARPPQTWLRSTFFKKPIGPMNAVCPVCGFNHHVFVPWPTWEYESSATWPDGKKRELKKTLFDSTFKTPHRFALRQHVPEKPWLAMAASRIAHAESRWYQPRWLTAKVIPNYRGQLRRVYFDYNKVVPLDKTVRVLEDVDHSLNCLTYIDGKGFKSNSMGDLRAGQGTGYMNSVERWKAETASAADDDEDQDTSNIPYRTETTFSNPLVDEDYGDMRQDWKKLLRKSRDLPVFCFKNGGFVKDGNSGGCLEVGTIHEQGWSSDVADFEVESLSNNINMDLGRPWTPVQRRANEKYTQWLYTWAGTNDPRWDAVDWRDDAIIKANAPGLGGRPLKLDEVIRKRESAPQPKLGALTNWCPLCSAYREQKHDATHTTEECSND